MPAFPRISPRRRSSRPSGWAILLSRLLYVSLKLNVQEIVNCLGLGLREVLLARVNEWYPMRCVADVHDEKTRRLC